MLFIRSVISQKWFQIALFGTGLFILVDLAIRYTRHFGFVPTMIILGAFIVPVAFAAYFYRQEYLLDRNIHGGIPLVMASIIFILSGIIGTIMAGVLEFQLDFDSKVALFLSASIIEEVTKLVFPIIIFFKSKYRTDVDGLVFGIASGMGFAAFETLGFGLITLMSYLTDITDLENILISRGLLAPLGHAAWTGLVCGALWHYRRKGKNIFLAVFAYFLLAVFLHLLWNLAFLSGKSAIMYPSFVAIGVIGLYLVFRRLNHAKRYPL